MTSCNERLRFIKASSPILQKWHLIGNFSNSFWGSPLSIPTKNWSASSCKNPLNDLVRGYSCPLISTVVLHAFALFFLVLFLRFCFSWWQFFWIWGFFFYIYHRSGSQNFPPNNPNNMRDLQATIWIISSLFTKFSYPIKWLFFTCVSDF